MVESASIRERGKRPRVQFVSAGNNKQTKKTTGNVPRIPTSSPRFPGPGFFFFLFRKLANKKKKDVQKNESCLHCAVLRVHKQHRRIPIQAVMHPDKQKQKKKLSFFAVSSVKRLRFDQAGGRGELAGGLWERASEALTVSVP